MFIVVRQSCFIPCFVVSIYCNLFSTSLYVQTACMMCEQMAERSDTRYGMLYLEALNISSSMLRRVLLGKVPGLGSQSQTQPGPGTDSSLADPRTFRFDECWIFSEIHYLVIFSGNPKETYGNIWEYTGTYGNICFLFLFGGDHLQHISVRWGKSRM